MKKILIVFLLFALSFSAFAEGETESGDWDRTISLAGGRSWVPELQMFYPDIEFSVVDIAQVSGDDITVSAMVAAGNAPDIYAGFTGRAGKYLVPEYALPLSIDESVWDTAVLDTYKHDGVLYGLPFSLPVQAMYINTTVAEAAGYTVPDGAWDIYDYIEMLEAIKASDYEGWPTFLYAGSPSADYLWLNWFSSFGIDLFAGDDYSRSAFNDTAGGVEVMKFFKYLIDNGLTPPDSAIRTVNEVLPGVGDGSIATTGFRTVWMPSFMQSAIDAGRLDEPFEYVYKPFPVKPGLDWPAPIPGVGTCVLAHKTDNAEKAAILTQIVTYIAGRSQQPAKSDILTRFDVEKEEEADEVTQAIIDYTIIGGFMDPAYTREWYGETRAGALPILRELYNGDISPEEAAADYEEMVNEILAEYK